MAEDASFPLSKAQAVDRVLPLLAQPPTTSSARGSFVVPIVTGLPASPGLASGPIATSPEAALAGADGGHRTILIRAETSPEDVHGMAAAAGILTSRGGLASHAAVVARGWGIPAVVGAAELEVGDGRITIGDRVLQAGEVITIDGSSGEVFEGTIPGTSDVVPEAKTLLDWARELGVAVGNEAPTDAQPLSPAAPGRKVTPNDCLRAVAIKGFAQTQAVADAVLATVDDVQPILDQLVVEGLLATTAGAYRLSENGTARAADLLEVERAAWGPELAVAALDAFLALDHRMKDAVTAWQLRDAAAQVINDHSDADYDRAVLDRLAAIHADAEAWMTPLETGWPRVVGYRARLTGALERAVDGDQRYVASPRVDSYHGIWFELHEDLLRLAGRTREEETAAGRA
jgi:pyruvate,orthophosphate dikinase